MCQKVKGRKGKVSVRAPKAQSGIGGSAPLILSLSTRETKGTWQDSTGMGACTYENCQKWNGWSINQARLLMCTYLN